MVRVVGLDDLQDAARGWLTGDDDRRIAPATAMFEGESPFGVGSAVASEAMRFEERTDLRFEEANSFLGNKRAAHRKERDGRAPCQNELQMKSVGHLGKGPCGSKFRRPKPNSI